MSVRLLRYECKLIIKTTCRDSYREYLNEKPLESFLSGDPGVGCFRLCDVQPDRSVRGNDDR